MKPLTLTLVEPAGLQRHDEPVRCGIPVPRGSLTGNERLRAEHAESGQSVPIQHSVTARWPDGSVKWLLVDMLASLNAGQTAKLTVQVDSDDIGVTEPSEGLASAAHQTTSGTGPGRGDGVSASQLDDATVLDNGRLAVQAISGRSGLQLRSSPPDGKSVERQIECALTDEAGQRLVFVPATVDTDRDHGQCRNSLTVSGGFQGGGRSHVIKATLTVSLSRWKPDLSLTVRIHNERAARHPGGRWDLGDAHSALFQDISVHISGDNCQSAELDAEIDAPRHQLGSTEGWALYQDSSGGEQWNSAAHVNRDGDVPTRFRGYQISQGENVLDGGDRADPMVAVADSSGSIGLYAERFWQNFPACLSGNRDGVRVGLFPQEWSDLHELQGGESKTHTLHVQCGESTSQTLVQMQVLRHPVVVLPSLDDWVAAEVVPFLCSEQKRNPLDSLIKRGIDGQHSFFAKRELTDEFGWRHFGDIVADHESLYEDDGHYLISHYNNQYDPIYGFIVQLLRDGDARWLDLLTDLATHVTDIDFYDTTEDRVEFNGGLFWHTEHYKDALTSSHRTYSRLQAGGEDGSSGGGGPGSEHCYTTGLMLHHGLTGDPRSREAVLRMADWMIQFDEGGPGLLASLNALYAGEVKELRRMLKGDRKRGFQQPLTRATGNYLIALLDAYELTSDGEWLARCARVIRQTVHPTDNIGERDLLSIEANWSYVVLLQGIARYLSVMEREATLDADYHYAQQSFLAYASWMLVHEKRYLDQTEQLEFPNDTWVAQEMRKCGIWVVAARYPGPDIAAFQQRADEFLAYLVDHLETSDSSHVSRIQILLLQNFCAVNAHVQLALPSRALAEFPPIEAMPELGWSEVLLRAFRKLGSGLLQFSPKREYRWLKARLVARAAR